MSATNIIECMSYRETRKNLFIAFFLTIFACSFIMYVGFILNLTLPCWTHAERRRQILLPDTDSQRQNQTRLRALCQYRRCKPRAILKKAGTGQTKTTETVLTFTTLP
jgi:hypothetical protein